MRAFKRVLRRDESLGVTYDELIDRYCHCPALIVDDVGMGGSDSAWEWGQLDEIINARYREHLITVLATNRDLKDLPERVVSRFSDPDIGLIVLNEGRDYRLRKV